MHSNCTTGGSLSDAYGIVKSMGGVQSAATYPYKGKKEQCLSHPVNFVTTISRAFMLSANEVQIAAWLALNAPVSVLLKDKPLAVSNMN